MPPARAVVARKGTLEYSAAGLVLLFFHLLWGDLCLQIMVLDVPQIIPLQVVALGGSNTWVLGLTWIMLAVCGIGVVPFASYRSDRMRTRLGRRRPMLMVATPLVALVLVAIGFSPEITRGLGGFFSPEWLAAHAHAVQLGLLGLLVLLFNVCNSFLQPIYAYFVVDVVPDRYMGRFLAMFRAVAYLASFLFQQFLFGHALTHTREIYCGTAVLFLLGFFFMCWRVSEPAYPPPPPSGPGVLATVRLYFRECFSHRHYLFLNVRHACFMLTFMLPTYLVLMGQQALGLPLSFIGGTNSYVALLSMVLMIPVGILCDRYHPLRFTIGATVYYLFVPLAAFLFLRDRTSFVVFVILLGVGRALFDGSALPLFAAIFPRDRFGQFASANQLFGSVCLMVGNAGLGFLLDWLTQDNALPVNYRYAFLAGFGFNLIGFCFLLLLYRSWKRHGGEAYVAP